MVVFQEVIFYALRHTAEYADDQGVGCWVQGVGCFPLSFEGSEHIEAMVDFLLGIIAHRTSVEKDGIRLLYRLANFIARHLHHRGHYFRVGHIHLTSVCFYQQLFHGCKDTRNLENERMRE